MDIEIVSDCRDQLGECPLWEPRSRCLFWIDARRHLLHRLQPQSGSCRQWTLPTEIGSIALCESGRLLVALQAEFCFLDPADGGVTRFAAISHPAEHMRLNDGRTDRAGRFCVGSLVMGRHEPLGRLYQLSPSGAIAELDRGICTANTTCFSPDGRWMYFADSLARQIWRYAYDPATGAAGAREIFVDRDLLGTAPDGATVDAQGRLWVALVMAGQLACITPDGQVERRIDLPVPHPTCPCFGDDGLDTIYVTSISNSGNLIRSDNPDSGALLAIRGTGATGLPEVRFADVEPPIETGGQQR